MLFQLFYDKCIDELSIEIDFLANLINQQQEKWGPTEFCDLFFQIKLLI
jgi:hypothetical protein